MIVIDGSQGEGGGQILRTSLALSAVSGKAFRIENIRANRTPPGLARQHLVAVQAAARVCGAEVLGAELGSQTLVFRPTRPQAGRYFLDIGSAGSTTLVLQTILPALLQAETPSEFQLIGGTHNPWAPPADFLDRVFLPLLRQMGTRVDFTVRRPGFYPRGGGLVEGAIWPCQKFKPLQLLERGPIVRKHAWAAVANLPIDIARREIATLKKRLHLDEPELAIYQWDCRGPGNFVAVEIECAGCRELFAGFGRRGVPAEEVADEVAAETLRWLEADVPVGEHLADQLLLPLALAPGGRFRTLTLSSHAVTNMEIIRKFLDVDFHIQPMGANTCEVKVVAA